MHGWLAALTAAVVIASCGSSGGDTRADTSLEDALVLRRDLTNQTGRQHLSLSDYIAIGDVACGGAVNDPDEMLDLAVDWGLDEYTSAAGASNAIWMSARQICPDRFSDQNFERGLPFSVGAAGVAPPSIRVEGTPPGFPDFVDLSVLDDTTASWADGIEVAFFSTTALGGEQAVDYFRDGFPGGWTVNEVLGPVTDDAGLSMWSIDVDGNGWSGVVDVMSGDIGAPNRDTLVLIFFAAS